MRAGMATHRPATVQISASAMPPESARGSPMPPAWMTLKERMMPVTVPSRPSSGDTPAIVPSVLRKRSSSWTTWRPVSSRRSISISRDRWRLASPVARSLPRGEFCSSVAITLSLTWFASISCHTRSGSSCGSTRLSCRVHRRSRTMAAAVIEHRMIGHISGPPARTISHILRDPWDLRLRRRHHTGGARPLKAAPPLRHAAHLHWRPSGRVRGSMPRRLLKRLVPDPHTLRERWFLRPFGARITDPLLWTLHRRGVTPAFGAGLAICFVPLPVHLLLATTVAVIWRLNIAVICGTTLLLNPFTAVPVYYLAYRVGAALLHVPRQHFRFVPSWHWLGHSLAPVWQPFIAGCITCALLVGIVGWLSLDLLWRWQVTSRYRTRHDTLAA